MTCCISSSLHHQIDWVSCAVAGVRNGLTGISTEADRSSAHDQVQAAYPNESQHAYDEAKLGCTQCVVTLIVSSMTCICVNHLVWLVSLGWVHRNH